MRPCTQCGKCCIKYSDGGLDSATTDEMDLWETERPDIFQYTNWVTRDLWLSPKNHHRMTRCPWLRKLPNQSKYTCRIHDYRPSTCSNYPVTVEQMMQDGCEMLEDGDWDKPHKLLMAELEKLQNT